MPNLANKLMIDSPYPQTESDLTLNGDVDRQEIKHVRQVYDETCDLDGEEYEEHDIDRRLHKRKAAIWKTLLETESLCLKCESRNVSKTGALLRSFELIDEGLEANVLFDVYHDGHHRTLDIECRIVRVTFDHQAFNIAVHFLEHESPDVLFLQAYSEA